MELFTRAAGSGDGTDAMTQDELLEEMLVSVLARLLSLHRPTRVRALCM